MYKHQLKLSDLEEMFNDLEGYSFFYNFYDYEETLNQIGFPVEFKDDITEILEITKDGDLVAIFLTESGSYYELDSIWHPLPYYINSDVQHSLIYTNEYWNQSNEFYSF